MLQQLRRQQLQLLLLQDLDDVLRRERGEESGRGGERECEREGERERGREIGIGIGIGGGGGEVEIGRGGPTQIANLECLYLQQQ